MSTPEADGKALAAGKKKYCGMIAAVDGGRLLQLSGTISPGHTGSLTQVIQAWSRHRIELEAVARGECWECGGRDHKHIKTCPAQD